MACLNPKVSWTIELTTTELRLILCGLDRMLREDEVAEAKELSEKLSRQRAASSKAAYEATDRLLGNIEAYSERKNK